MALPDPADHDPACPAIESGQSPALVIQLDPGRDAMTVQVSIWELCTRCGTTTAFTRDRLPWRTWHRKWRAHLAVWIATWEHRHNLGGKITRA